MTTSSIPGALPKGVNAYDPAATRPAAANSLGTSAAQTQDNFMKMLLAQIQNQDPMSPQDPAQMTSQLTQLTMASGIERLNTSISSMLNQVTAQSFMNDSSLIGSSVLAPGNSLQIDATGGSDFGLKLGADSAQTKVAILASDGSVVDELSLGALGQGVHTFTWDGAGYDGKRVSGGKYRLVLTAADAAGAAVASVALTRGVVNGVSRVDTGSQLLTSDGRSINLVDVVQLTKP